MHEHWMSAGIMAPLLDDGGFPGFSHGIKGLCYTENVKDYLYFSRRLTALGRS
jgi:hypothetical protein